jgi:hypothetical protein
MACKLQVQSDYIMLFSKYLFIASFVILQDITLFPAKAVWLIEMTQKGCRTTNQKGNALDLFCTISQVIKVSFINRKSLFLHPQPLYPTTVLKVWLQNNALLSVLLSGKGRLHLLNYFYKCEITKFDSSVWPKAFLYLSCHRWTLRIWKTGKSLALPVACAGMRQRFWSASDRHYFLDVKVFILKPSMVINWENLLRLLFFRSFSLWAGSSDSTCWVTEEQRSWESKQFLILSLKMDHSVLLNLLLIAPNCSRVVPTSLGWYNKP